MRVYYRGELTEAEQLTTAGGQVFWQIGRSFVSDSDVAIPEAPRFTPDSPPPAPSPSTGLSEEPEPPAVVLSSKSKRGKKSAPVVAGHDDPPQGGELSEDVLDPRDR